MYKRQVLGVAIPDVPGGLNKVLQVLTDARINVEYMYAFLGGKTEAAYMIFRVEDNNAAAEALASRGIKTLEEADIQMCIRDRSGTGSSRYRGWVLLDTH